MAKKEGFRASFLLNKNKPKSREKAFFTFFFYSLQRHFERKPKILMIFIYIRMNKENRWTTKHQPHPTPLTLSIWHRVNDGQNSELSPLKHNLVCNALEQRVHYLSVRLSGISIYDAIGYEMINPQDCVAWENSRHFTTPLLGSLRNDVWEKSAEIPYLWRVTTQIWEVRLIG